MVPILLALAACGPGESAPGASEVRTGVVAGLRLAGEEPEGVAPGFDLDGHASDTRDELSCFQQDFLAPDGRTGIDNQLARLLPLIDLAGQGAVEALVQGAINEGRLLLLFELEERADGRTDLTLLRGEDVPLIGTDGRLLAGQTLALAAEPELGRFEDVRREGEVIIAGPMDLRLPVVVFSILYDLQLEGAFVRFELGEDGALHGGVIGGGARVAQLLEFVRIAGEQANADLLGLLGGSIQDSADLDVDLETGECNKVSLSATFDAVPAFIF